MLAQTTGLFPSDNPVIALVRGIYWIDVNICLVLFDTRILGRWGWLPEAAEAWHRACDSLKGDGPRGSSRRHGNQPSGEAQAIE